ncbi:centrosomal protein of 63 kDa-like [Watersipora subatra]|uniref:centrosomal protein of 63 kDa-like n=1 Tax=Watersipora subatra TaxID=2589382 RepID=UPI00355BF6E1
MSGLELTELYRELQRTGHGLSKTSPLITSCESELSELIRQIDIMFKVKRNDWEKERATFELKVETKVRELQLQQESIDRKNLEINRLREQTSQLEKEDKKLISDYQFQVEKLHKDLTMLRKQYEKMRTRHQKEKVKLATEKYETEASNLSKDKKQLELEVEKLVATVKALTDKCELMEQQGTTYQDQLAKRKQMIGDIESHLRAEIASLSSQLHKTEDKESEQSVEIARLKADLNHWKNKSTKLIKDLQSADELLKKSNSLAKNLQTQNDSLTAELKAQGSNLHMATRGQHCQEKEMAKLRDMLIEKDKTIRSLLDKQYLDESAALDVLKQDVLKADEDNRELKAKEVEYRAEISQLKGELSTLNLRLINTDQECLSLREQLHQKATELRQTEDRILRERDSNLNELQMKMFSLREDHDAELARLKRELQNCRAQLCEAMSRNNQTCLMTTFSEGDDTHSDAVNAALDESQAAADLRLTKQQLVALRLENQHLQDQLVTSSHIGSDVRQSQKQMNIIQDSYGGTVERLQADNERLRSDIDRLRDEMKRTNETHHRKYCKLLKDMQEDIERREARLHEEQELNNARTEVTNNTLHETRESVYQHEKASLQEQKNLLMERLDQTEVEMSQCMEANCTLTQENQLMASFAGNISEVMAMASSSKKDVSQSHYNSAYDDQTTDFFGLRTESPDPVRRLISDEATLNCSSSKMSNKSQRSSHSRENHNCTSTPKKSSFNSSLREKPSHSRTSSAGHPSHSRTSSVGRSSHSRTSSATRQHDVSKSPTHGPSKSSPCHRSAKGRHSTSPPVNHPNRSSSSEGKQTNLSPRVQAERSPSPGARSFISSPSRISSFHGHDYSESFNTSSTGSMIAEKFLRDQRQRTAALEQMLDQHIQGLRDDSKQLISDNQQYLM